MSRAVPPVRPSQQADLFQSAREAAMKGRTAAAGMNNGRQQNRPNPEGQNRTAVKRRSQNPQTECFAEIIHEEERKISC